MARDEIGESAKRSVRRASLQRPFNNQILDLEAMQAYCNIKSVKFIVIDKNEMGPYRQACITDGRYVKAKTIPGIHRFHCYTSLEDLQNRMQNFCL